jgi:hypothetical protein
MSVTVSTSTTTKLKEMRARVARLAFSTTDTSATLERGVGYQMAIGGYTDYTLSTDTLTLTVVGATSAYANVLLIGA